MNSKTQFRFDRLLAVVTLSAILVMAIASTMNAQATDSKTPSNPSADESSTHDRGSRDADLRDAGNWNQTSR
jgi:hypothetical protein